RLHQALGPARLLGFECVHLHRQFGRAINLRQVNEMPAAKLSAIGKVGVLSKRVVLPAARVLDGGTAPDSSGAVEIEKQAAAEARRVFDDEVAVEKNCFDFSER